MSTTFKSPFILVDGSSYLFRAYHALPPLTTSKGQATGAIYGVISMLRKLRTDYQSTHIAVVFDTKGKTFRHDLYPEYKANRAVMPEDLAEQIAPLHAIIQAMGFPLVAIPGIEADDVIGTLAIEAQKHQWPVLISTGDKDMAQLVNQSVTLVNTMTEKILDINGVIEKFGIRPEQMIDYLTLMGDSIDNVPGIPGVGPKTAVKWLQTYGSLDAIIAHADHINGKVGEQLRLTLPQLPLLKTLVTIKSDCKLPVMLEELMLKPSNQESLIHWFRELEFKRWLSEADDVRHPGNAAGVVHDPGITEKHYHTVLTEAEFDRWLTRLEKASLFAIDIETTSLDCTDAEIVGLSFAMTPYEAAYVPLAHCYIGAPVQCDRDTILKKLKPLLENPDLKKVGQHIKYDMNVLANYGITLRGIAYDTMLESYILNSTANRHDLETLALRHLDEKTVSFQELAGKGAKQITFDYVAIEQAAPYAAEDADITLRLHHVLWPQLQKIPALADIFNTIELPLIPVLSRMECRGVLIDKARLKEQGIVIKERVQQLTTQAFHLAGSEFNLASPKQLQFILFEKMQLPVLKKTPTGQPSTNEDVLEILALDYPLPKILLEHRHLSKLLSTYIDKLPEQISSKTGRIHTSYHQAVAATGRLSSSDPNLQNIPIRTEEGRRIRRAFVAPSGYKLVAADYSQIELRIMAHLSKDKTLLNAFANQEDIHRSTAAEVFHVKLEHVTVDQRRSAKAINFGLIYGMSAFGLARQLGITKQQAQTYIDLYFDRYPGVKQYMENTRQAAREQGYVETLFGRRLYLPDLKAHNKMLQQAAERTAINAPLQGTAADIIKKAMIRIDAWLQESKLDCKMIMQVHDELVFEVHHNEVETLLAQLPQCMCEGFPLDVPLQIDLGVADNWEEAH